jgi:hypothetical protein
VLVNDRALSPCSAAGLNFFGVAVQQHRQGWGQRHSFLSIFARFLDGMLRFGLRAGRFKMNEKHNVGRKMLKLSKLCHIYNDRNTSTM